jgi:hypothetical protein
MTSRSPDSNLSAAAQPKAEAAPGAPGPSAAARLNSKALREAINRLMLARPWLLALLGGLATLAILLVLGWFFLVSPYSGPAEFVYNQF